MKVAARIYVLNSTTQCYRCGLPTPVFALAADTVYLPEEGWLDNNDEDPLLYLLMDPEELPTLIADELNRDAQASAVYLKSDHDEVFRNHCIHCGCGQGNFYLISEPGGAFAPETEEEAGLIGGKLIPIEGEIELEASYSVGGLRLADVSGLTTYAPSEFVAYYCIKAEVSPEPGHMAMRPWKESRYLSANCRLAGDNGMAHVESWELAERFLKALRPRLEKRYPGGLTLTTCPMTSKRTAELLQRIQTDSSIIGLRIEHQNFSPNKSPYS